MKRVKIFLALGALVIATSSVAIYAQQAPTKSATETALRATPAKLTETQTKQHQARAFEAIIKRTTKNGTLTPKKWTQIKTPVIAGDFSKLSIQEMLKIMKKYIRITIPYEILSDKELNLSEPSSLILPATNTKDFLNMLLDNSLQDEALDWMVNDSRIAINFANRLLATKLYNVADLVTPARDKRSILNDMIFSPQPTPTPKPIAKTETTGSGGGVFYEDPEPTLEEPLTKAELLEKITRIIRVSIDPESWMRDNGSGSICAQNYTQLIITNSPANHRKIQKLLDAMRTNAPHRMTVRTWVVRLTPADLTALQATQKKGSPLTIKIADLQKLIKPGEKKSTKLISQNQTDCFDSQWVSQESLTANVDKRKLESGTLTGPVIDFRPTIYPTHKNYVKLQLRMVYALQGVALLNKGISIPVKSRSLIFQTDTKIKTGEITLIGTVNDPTLNPGCYAIFTQILK